MTKEEQNNEALLFQAALGIQSPWFVTHIDLQQESHELHIYLDFERGSEFPCPTCNSPCKCYDTKNKVWQHLTFFQYKTYIHARVPRVSCNEHGIHLVEVPWARQSTGFSLLMEAFMLTLCKETTVKGVERVTGVTDKRIWNVLDHYVGNAVKEIDSSNMTSIGIDETSRKKGHNYITVAVDMETRKVFHVTEGKGKSTVKYVAEAITSQGGNILNIKDISMDMSPSFIEGCKEYFPFAKITFDKFHLMKLVNMALDLVRRDESKIQASLKKTRYIWLKNLNNLTEKQHAKLKILLKDPYLKTAKAYILKLQFQDFWNCPFEEAECFLFDWIRQAKETQLEPLIQVANTIIRHWDGIIRWFESHINNGCGQARSLILEGVIPFIVMLNQQLCS
jgi:transposase